MFAGIRYALLGRRVGRGELGITKRRIVLEVHPPAAPGDDAGIEEQLAVSHSYSLCAVTDTHAEVTVPSRGPPSKLTWREVRTTAREQDTPMARKNKGEPGSADGFLAETMQSVSHATQSKAVKKAVKAERKAAKQAKKAAKRARKAGEALEPDQAAPSNAPEERRITPSKVRNAVNLGKVIVPAVIPVIAPIAVRAAGGLRETYDKYQARRLGVDVDSLGEYSGHGASLHARIAGLSDGLSELRAGGDAEGARFAAEAASTVRQLSSAVRAAEHMPAPRRKEAHKAVAAELDELEAKLLHHLGV